MVISPARHHLRQKTFRVARRPFNELSKASDSLSWLTGLKIFHYPAKF